MQKGRTDNGREKKVLGSLPEMNIKSRELQKEENMVKKRLSKN